jgi:hypothetical protein
MVVGFGEPRSGDRKLVNRSRLLPLIAVAPSGLDDLLVLTQGSQSLALGLTLTAATQLRESN